MQIFGTRTICGVTDASVSKFILLAQVQKVKAFCILASFTILKLASLGMLQNNLINV